MARARRLVHDVGRELEATGLRGAVVVGALRPGPLRPLRAAPDVDDSASRWPAASSASGPRPPPTSGPPWPISRQDSPGASCSASARATRPSSSTTPAPTRAWSSTSTRSMPSTSRCRRTVACSPPSARACSSSRRRVRLARTRTSCRSSTPTGPAPSWARVRSSRPRSPSSSRPIPPEARELARGYAGTYLALPNYTNNLRTFGFGDDDIGGGGSDRLIDAVIPWGDADDRGGTHPPAPRGRRRPRLHPGRGGPAGLPARGVPTTGGGAPLVLTRLGTGGRRPSSARAGPLGQPTRQPAEGAPAMRHARPSPRPASPRRSGRRLLPPSGTNTGS